MEGRLALNIPASELEKVSGLKLEASDVKKYYSEPLYNIPPSSYIPIITSSNTEKIRFYKWGLIPSGTNSKSSKGLSSIPVRSFRDKPAFQKALLNKRGVVIVSGYYLWKESPAGKIPYYVTLKSKNTFGIPALWDSLEDDEDSPSNTCCLITQKQGGNLSYFPNDMPLCLLLEKSGDWLNNAGNIENFFTNDFFIDGEEFEYYPVNRKIIKSTDNNPKFVQKTTYLVAEQQNLF